ncbi:hypothetical protein BDB00DRAFT_104331 [Zychaea mexicana]|uniref:uncharacterized protein n=1 Tax=Zychaea mexicana TaxID=64656 RepID=UPI0022FDDBA0|nr:uncharacterized protein BDB00DRAFT_104331 [Zychaea mexicana]KAI9496706.1 hypothetical protein BDB00DRAFT_104331 [Zychaea mexicana]
MRNLRLTANLDQLFWTISPKKQSRRQLLPRLTMLISLLHLQSLHHHQHQPQPEQQSYLPSTTATSTTTHTAATSTANSYILPQITQHHPTPQQQHLPRIAPAPGLHIPITPNWSMSSSPLTPTASSSTLNTCSSRKRKQPPTTTTNNNNTSSSGDGNITSSSSETNDSEKFLAEEDKRRRNTAASARFRMKKKMREQALEQTAKEMSDKAEELEKRVKELELEAKWLRALVVEKDPKLLDKPTSFPSETS